MRNQLRSLLNSRRRPFRLFQIEASLDCSLECVMCPWLEMRASGAMMSWGTFSRIVESFHLTESVDLTGGGEPTKNPLLPEMAAAAKAAGCETGFSTNGNRLGRPLAEQLVDLGLDWISFSVDAATPQLYERIRRGAHFEHIIGNIAGLNELIHDRGAPGPRLMMVYVMMTGETENFHELPQFIELAHSLGVSQVIAKNLDVIVKDGDDARRIFSHEETPERRAQEAIEAARARAKTLGVGLRLYAMRPVERAICEHDPLHSLFFNWEGYVSPCITLSYAEDRVFNGERVHAPCQRYGNICEEPFESIWKRADYRCFRKQLDDRLKTEQHAAVDVLLGGAAEGVSMPPAPEGCRTCYYLYGV